jgi:hypothetical protein
MPHDPRAAYHIKGDTEMYGKTTLLAAFALMLLAPAQAIAASSYGTTGGSTEKKICKNTYTPAAYAAHAATTRPSRAAATGCVSS